MEEKIDVLLATYNGEKYLKEQIDSILNQTYKNIHLIVSDDSSRDGTRQILKQYETDERITIHYQEENLGYVKNFEFLLQQVESEYYMLSDQDDVWRPEKIAKSMETLKNNDADMVFGDLEVVDENLKTIYSSFGDFMKLNRKIKKQINSYEVNYLYNCVTGCTVLSKKEFIKDILPIPTSSKYLIHDHWMGLIISLNGKLAYMSEKYIKYRQHGNNQVGTDKISHKFNKLDQVRELFINVKLGIFETYVENNDKFPKKLQQLNKQGLDYFKMLQNKKHFNFKGWNIYHKLYKNETLFYYILNFIIMNLPFIGRGLFNIRYAILKLLKKR
ncbi:MAG: glycosyltransferase family 2 protein [Clostridia bacterium]|nr:glycosyltransferase family 2 protein [Clostridia bacterium]